MQTITIRPMLPADIDLCAQAVASTPLWQRYGVTHQSAADRLSAGLRAGATLLVAQDDSDRAPLGFIWLVIRGAFDLSGYIRWIVVAPDRRSGGVGGQLLTAAEEFIRPTCRDMFLLCSDFNVDAQRFYERNGYSQVGALPDYVLMGVTELIYRKRLPSSQ